MSSMTVYSLAIHADYRCHQTGVCCRADWHVPVEASPLELMRSAVESGQLPAPALAFVEGSGGVSLLAHDDEGACVFQDASTNLCTVHSRLGEGALPVGCRVFPRVALRDVRGVRITLSNFCPTAAAMLWRSDKALAIERNPIAFPAQDYDGLDARGDWPPLVCPGILADYEGFDAWEAHAVSRLAEAPTPTAALSALRFDAETIAQWRPGGATLTDAIGDLPWCERLPRGSAVERYEEVRDAIPSDLRPRSATSSVQTLDEAPFSEPTRRFVAAHAFASWCAYQGYGVRTFVRSLEAALAVVRVEADRQSEDAGRALDRMLLTEAFRMADLRLRHQASPEALARVWSRAESEPSGSKAPLSS